jgi:hypothetical protein
MERSEIVNVIRPEDFHCSYAEAFNARPQVRYGRPDRPLMTPPRYESQSHFKAGELRGSHMPIDTDIHWTWRNPLNSIPALIVLLLLIAVMGMVLS